ncbi:MAG: hypothetical protein OXS33_08355 [bacterium]|nr:hypothetical protein [bacterium]MDE0501970.1 hypothetical protein [bacterium]
MNNRPAAVVLVMTALVTGWTLYGCGGDPPDTPLDAGESRVIVGELGGRSFRQFDPSRDGSPRKAVILDFSGEGRVSLWAQYAEGERAIHEWEIVSEEFGISGNADGSEVTVVLGRSRSERLLPSRCRDCIDATGVSIGIRDVFDPDRIAFRITDAEGVLPLPFPVFESWTDFEEDEYFE